MQEKVVDIGSSGVSEGGHSREVLEQSSFSGIQGSLIEEQNPTVNVDHEPSWLIYPLDNYGIRVQDNAEETGSSIPISEMNGFNTKVDNFLKDGIGRSVAALMLTHRYLCPHVVLLQNDLTSEWMLPNCSYKAWENPRTVLANFLKSLFLTSSNSSASSGNSLGNSGSGGSNTNGGGFDNAVEVGEYLGTWWRTEFNYSPLPYLPPHSTRPKEIIRIYQVILPPKLLFKLPKHHVLKSLPLFDLDPNIFGIACGSIPQLISRFQIQSMVQSEN
ncbi:putative mRNA cleavage factor-like protein [Cryptosporidium felis]|nr:putative mRNA cleavage factor-like protein [Cryptosporidium felis]